MFREKNALTGSVCVDLPRPVMVAQPDHIAILPIASACARSLLRHVIFLKVVTVQIMFASVDQLDRVLAAEPDRIVMLLRINACAQKMLKLVIFLKHVTLTAKFANVDLANRALGI